MIVEKLVCNFVYCNSEYYVIDKLIENPEKVDKLIEISQFKEKMSKCGSIVIEFNLFSNSMLI